MAGAGCGSALVLTAGMVVGIITERDVLNRIVAQTADPASTAVEAVMTRKPVCAHPDMPVVHALYTMKELGFRHFPVINDKHEPLGVFCLRDAFPEELAGAAYLKKSLQKMIKTQRH